MAIELVEQLRSAGCVFAEDEAKLLRDVTDDDEVLQQLVSRRIRGEPLEYVVGFVEFLGDRYLLGPGVFIPRQRSTLLVHEAIRLGGRLILDVCCGCGALGLATSRRLGAALVSTDIEATAIAYARVNGVTDAHIGDLFAAVPRAHQGEVSLLIANTPYVPSGAVAAMPRESRDYEPRSTVDGGADGMDIQRRVLNEASLWLEPNGRLLTETSRAQASDLCDVARAAGLEPRIVTDAELGATVLVARLPS
ncbi:MAG TPA: putative protein N(5)-glutamine methyltransferase [Marmoricola sp.]|nr:putative protein N(5)-glutamine methyltransferase [Marmoricola sp.]